MPADTATPHLTRPSGPRRLPSPAAWNLLVGGLPEGQRQVLVLRDVYGQSTEEVANAMGLTPGAVKVRLFRARERLKSGVGGDRRRPVVALAGRRRATGRRS